MSNKQPTQHGAASAPRALLMQESASTQQSSEGGQLEGSPPRSAGAARREQVPDMRQASLWHCKYSLAAIRTCGLRCILHVMHDMT